MEQGRVAHAGVAAGLDVHHRPPEGGFGVIEPVGQEERPSQRDQQPHGRIVRRPGRRSVPQKIPRYDRSRYAHDDPSPTPFA